jgi:hypothetical protein
LPSTLNEAPAAPAFLAAVIMPTILLMETAVSALITTVCLFKLSFFIDHLAQITLQRIVLYKLLPDISTAIFFNAYHQALLGFGIALAFWVGYLDNIGIGQGGNDQEEKHQDEQNIVQRAHVHFLMPMPFIFFV